MFFNSLRFTSISSPQMIDDEAVHDNHQEERNEEHHNIQGHIEDLFQGRIRPYFATFTAPLLLHKQVIFSNIFSLSNYLKLSIIKMYLLNFVVFTISSGWFQLRQNGNR